MNTVVHLRKLCNHPFLFENVEDECREFWKIPEITGFIFISLLDNTIVGVSCPNQCR